MIFKLLICIIVGYAFGCISSAYIIGKLNHIDIRSYGSGNAGTTNAMRTLGKKAGIMTYIGDAFKTVIPILLMAVIFAPSMKFHLACLITGLGVVLGHNYPFWLGFKGGKGIAVTSMVILMYNPPLAILYLAIFVAIIKFLKYVSVGSLAIVTVFFLQVTIFSFNEPYYLLQFFLALIFCVLAYYSHRTNIERLLNGTENKVGQKKK